MSTDVYDFAATESEILFNLICKHCRYHFKDKEPAWIIPFLASCLFIKGLPFSFDGFDAAQIQEHKKILTDIILCLSDSIEIMSRIGMEKNNDKKRH